MTDLLPLSIFPEGALASSVTTTVWVGIAVVVFFNLRFGWVLSGLVVPGYLVPLLIAKPAAAAVVVGEAIVTYWLVWFYSEFLSARFGWSNFFGRDRFFALVLSSVLVRVVADGFLLPALGEWINQNFQTRFDYRHNFHSFGLIIVSLIANNFWKTGLRRGLVPLFVTVGITYLLVRYVLMTATNFNISSLSYIYEDLASNILASPKAYIILIATAFLASRMNLLYGWDFSGILVPSLLALQWYQPGKILASFVEAGVILVLAHFALKLPVFRGITMEGGRKLLLFFNISYLYKFVLAYVLLWLWPEQKISDLYGFGYLLPTLIATKMHDKGIHARMTRAILQTSIVATFGATLVGFAASFLPNPWSRPAVVASRPPPPVATAEEQTLVEAARRERVALHRDGAAASPAAPSDAELLSFRSGLAHLARYEREREASALEHATRELAAAGFHVQHLEGRYLVLREAEPRRGLGMFALDLQAASALAVQVPAPADERGAAEAGVWLHRIMAGRSLAIAGSARDTRANPGSDVLVAEATPYQLFHETFGGSEVLQVRAYTAQAARVAEGRRRDAEALQVQLPAAGLWVTRAIPEGLDLARLRSLVGTLDLRWGELPLPNRQRETTQGAFAELRLRPEDVRQLLGRALAGERVVAEAGEERSLEGYLQDWLLGDEARIAGPGTNLYRKPTVEELLFFDAEIVAPLLEAASSHYQSGRWTPAGEEALRIVQASASVLGYELLRYHDLGSGSDYLVLSEAAEGPQGERRYWGSYVFRLGASEPFLVQAPRPQTEVNSLEMAVALFETLRGRALLIAGASPQANLDRSADILRQENKQNIFNAVNQTLLREAGDAPLMGVQVRAIGQRSDVPMPDTDVVIATASGAASIEALGPTGARLAEALDRYGLSQAVATGSAAQAGYEASGQTQSFYLNAARNKELVTLWVSPLARAAFLPQTEPTGQHAQSMALGLPTVHEEIGAYVARHGKRLAPLPGSLREALAPYFRSQDIVVLYGGIRRHPGLAFERLVDVASRQGFLAVRDARGQLLGLANLGARDPGSAVAFRPEAPRESLQEFVDSRAAWLLAGEPR